jgi:hypothetical protein
MRRPTPPYQAPPRSHADVVHDLRDGACACRRSYDEYEAPLGTCMMCVRCRAVAGQRQNPLGAMQEQRVGGYEKHMQRNAGAGSARGAYVSQDGLDVWRSQSP